VATADGVEARATDGLRGDVARLCDGDGLRAVVQPIVRLTDMVVVGYEALSRIEGDPQNRSIQWWLDAATHVGLRSEFEIACWHRIAALGAPPEEALLFANVSPATLLEPELARLRDAMPNRLVIEVTEQAPVDDYAILREELANWLASGARIAIDDTGAGYSSLRHVIELTPDFLKLDRAMVEDIDRDRNRYALVRSLVAFAREVGTSVIAEGIERMEELDVLRRAGVAFGQGFLLARPGAAWPALGIGREAGTEVDTHSLRDQVGLGQALRAARTAEEACSLLADRVFAEGDMMPSIYLQHDDRLRCVAQRGLWQVLDGLAADAGVTGRTWATGAEVELASVTRSAEYLEAIPGVVAEICVPIVVEDRVVGALNVESLSPLPDGTLARMRTYSQLLARRLSVIGFQSEVSSWQRTARASARIADLVFNRFHPGDTLRVICEAALHDSACLIRGADKEFVVGDAFGPLAEAFLGLELRDRASLAGVVDRVSSCYSAGESTGHGFVGTESLRTAGARAVIVLPLRANGDRIGTIVLANTRPLRIAADEVEPLELLAAQLAATLHDRSIHA
jgi:EAL domain-containing protein (putative c-di-GMP-specific phosphodiesterase class I)/putative methionine-R-sulfoxide reductase with GAF domain